MLSIAPLLRSGLAGLAIAWCAAGAAGAQSEPLNDRQLSEAYCVYDALAETSDDDFETIALSTLRAAERPSNSSEEARADFLQASRVVETAAGKCAAAYDWSQPDRRRASDVARFGLVMEYLAGGLTSLGVPKETMERMVLALDQLSEQDLSALSGPDWQAHKDLHARVVVLMLATGLPNENTHKAAALRYAAAYVRMAVELRGFAAKFF